MMQVPSKLWFERLYSRLGFTFLLGAVIIGYLGFLVLLAFAYLAVGRWADYVTQVTFYASVPAFAIILIQLVAKYSYSLLRQLEGYAQTLAIGQLSFEMRSIDSRRGITMVWLLFAILVQPLYFLRGLNQFSPIQSFVIYYLPWLYFNVFIAFGLWVVFYSLYSIYRMGKLPMKLKSFVEDRTLGLRPFAAASLRLTVTLIAFVTFLSLPQILVGLATPLLLGLFVAILAIGFALFSLPLLSLRRKLLAAKREELGWIVPRYLQIVHNLKQDGNHSIGSQLLAELGALDKVQRDVQQIHAWPFDTGILARLIAILLSVVAILLSGVIRNLLRI